jgi:BCD family chlorophyll transporter-like MFS transporter
VGLTLLPIDSTLNRIMITELGISATLVALLVSVPYLLSPMQLWIGSLGEQCPIWGYHRSPYIIIGLFLCAFGAASSPTAAFAIYEGLWWGIPFGFVAFGAWGFGFNFATVSYLALATELSSPQERSKTVGVMWFVLILSMIIGGISFSRAIEPYSHERLITAFLQMAGLALGIGLLGVIGLERRGSAAVPAEQRPSMQVVMRTLWGNPQAKRFFVYLILLLVGILGQDILLEPYAGDIFGVPPAVTTRYTSIWGATLLVGLLITSPLTKRFGMKRVAASGAVIAATGLALIVTAGAVPGLAVFGFGSGISTAANLALMLDMTVAGQVGIFIGAWGVADALARFGGTMLSGIVRDVVGYAFGSVYAGYAVVFGIEIVLFVLSLILLRHIEVKDFTRHATTRDVIATAGKV